MNVFSRFKVFNVKKFFPHIFSSTVERSMRADSATSERSAERCYSREARNRKDPHDGGPTID